jgi:hypothetical protein
MKAEELQLETAESLFAAIAIKSIVALRLLDLRERVRLSPDAPAEQAGLNELELAVLGSTLLENMKKLGVRIEFSSSAAESTSWWKPPPRLTKAAISGCAAAIRAASRAPKLWPATAVEPRLWATHFASCHCVRTTPRRASPRPPSPGPLRVGAIVHCGAERRPRSRCAPAPRASATTRDGTRPSRPGSVHREAGHAGTGRPASVRGRIAASAAAV